MLRLIWLTALSMFLAPVVVAAPAPTAPPVAKGPSAEQIQKAIEDLSSPRFPVRERASKVLWDAGTAAEPALREAAKSKDEETSNRAKASGEGLRKGGPPANGTGCPAPRDCSGRRSQTALSVR